MVVVLGMMVSLVQVSQAEPMGTAWTYQGRLIDANEAADGEYDFTLKLFDDANTTTGVQQGGTIDLNDLDVIDGYFTLELDFGSLVFGGDARWLETAVRPGDSNDVNDFVTLSPRQKVTPTPYALYALSGPATDWNNLINVPSGFLDGEDNDTFYTAGEGLMLSGTTFEADTSYLQRRVAASCPVGSFIRAIEATGNVVCGPDNDSGGDITAVNAGTGLNGGGTSGNVTMHVDVPLYLSGSVAEPGAVIKGINTGDGRGVYGSGSVYGVYGYSDENVAVYGNGDTTGVYGDGTICGVHGRSTNGDGVSGYSTYGYAGYFEGDCKIINGDITIPNMMSYPWPAGGYNVKTINGTLFYENSSSRYKENIEPFGEEFSKILQVELKSYTCKKTGRREIGCIAEEFDELGLCELVIYDQEGRPDAIAYQMISLYLLEVLKDEVETTREQEKAINQLERKNRKLEERVDALERMMQRQQSALAKLVQK